MHSKIYFSSLPELKNYILPLNWMNMHFISKPWSNSDKIDLKRVLNVLYQLLESWNKTLGVFLHFQVQLITGTLNWSNWLGNQLNQFGNWLNQLSSHVRGIVEAPNHFLSLPVGGIQLVEVLACSIEIWLRTSQKFVEPKKVSMVICYALNTPTTNQSFESKFDQSRPLFVVLGV